MGTRSIVLVKKSDNGKTTVHRLYKHWDGYPTDNLTMIGEALKTLNNFSDVLHGFVKACQVYYEREDMIEETFNNETFDLEMLGNQGDLEWIYTVDLDAKQVKVFGGGYTGKVPQVAYSKGTVNPLLYADRLRKEYQDNERQRIQAAIDTIKALEYKLN